MLSEIVEHAAVLGVAEIIAGLQASLVDALFEEQPNPNLPIALKKLSMLQAQKAIDPKAYGPLDFANDSYDALLG